MIVARPGGLTCGARFPQRRLAMTDRFATLLLVRHGQARSDDGSYDRETRLSELGRLQVEVLAGELAGRAAPSAVYTSPFLRATETAAPICRRLGLEAVVDPRLAELEVGAISLATVEQRPDLALWLPEHRGTEDSETLGEFFTRVAAFCDEVAARSVGEKVALVAHAGTIDAAIRWALGLPPSTPWQHEFDLGNGSITEIKLWPDGRKAGGAPRFAVLRRVGDTAHLGELASDL